MDVKRDILWRVGLAYAGLIIFAVCILGRIFQLQYIQGDVWRSKVGELAQKDIVIEPNRGNIISADGKLMAISVPFYEIRMDMKAEGLKKDVFNKSIDSLSQSLANLFGDRHWQDYKKELKDAYRNGKRFHLIKSKVNFQELKQMKKFPLFRLGQYKGGFIVKQENIRVKPFGYLAARTIGNVSETRTVVGLEGAYDIDLRGVEGVKLMQRLAGDIWMPIRDGNEVEPQDGRDIITTIDIGLQDVAESALRNQLMKNEAEHGCAILMEVETGEIKAIANLTRNEDGVYVEKLNYAISAATEPGSTFKLISMIVAMEDGYITNLDDTINTGNGKVTYYKKTLKDSHEGGYGRISMQEVFEKSSNVGVSKIIWNHYREQPTKFINRIYKMKLNQKLGLEIKGEGVPKIKDPSDTSWSGITLPWMSIGYEVQMTPLQVLNFYNAIANNGVMVKPQFVKEIRYHGELIKAFPTEVINPSVCTKSTLEMANKMLLGVVENGTATNLKNPNYKIAGKTGTAQIAQNNAGYSTSEGKKSYQASFVGFFPADKPKYSCIVVISSPSKSVYYGNLVAGPVFKEIADKVFATCLSIQPTLAETKKLPIPFCKNGHRKDIENICGQINLPLRNKNLNSDWVVVMPDSTAVNLQNRAIHTGKVPNVIGMGLKDAIYVLENNGLKVKVSGKGSVIWQSLEPGGKIMGNNIISIQLG